MRKVILGLVLFIFSSCFEDFRMEYYFQNHTNGFFAVIYNSQNGIQSEKSNGQYKYYFGQSNILLVKEAQPTGKGQTKFYYVNENNTAIKELIYKKSTTRESTEIIVDIANVNSYTTVHGKKVDYNMFVLAPSNHDLTDEQKIAADKKINQEIQDLHKKIDSMINIGIL